MRTVVFANSGGSTLKPTAPLGDGHSQQMRQATALPLLRRVLVEVDDPHDPSALSARSCEFGQSLRARRKGRGVTLENLAERTGLSERTLRVLEAGGGSLASVEGVVRALDLALTGLPRSGDGRSIGPRLVAARLKQGLNPPTLARTAGLDTRTLLKLEAGRGHMQSLWPVLDALGRDLDVRSGDITRRTTPADRDDRFTPSDFLQKLTQALGPVALDPCANRLSPVQAERRLYREDDGLSQLWTATGLVFVNPPYSNTLSWIRKAVEEHVSGRASLVALLTKAVTNGAGFRLLHEHGDILLLERRIAFLGADGQRMGHGTVSAWGSALTVLGADAEQVARLRERFEGVLISRAPERGT